MTTLHIGNNRTTEMNGTMAGLEPAERLYARCAAQRFLWFARDGDVLVLPQVPQHAYLDYVTSLTGTDAASLRFVVPPPGYAGPDIITEDRLADRATRDAVREALAGRALDRVLAFYPDASVAALARSLGAAAAMPGHAFFAQGGSALANSKAAFRAIAAGVGIPVAAGTVAGSRQAARDAIGELLAAGHPVILKQEFHSASDGNEILSPAPGLEPFGAQRVVVAADDAAVEDYLERRWDWLTDGGLHLLVVERYFVGVRPVYAEFLVDERGIEYTGQGELLMAPTLDGIVIPAPGLSPDEVGALVDRSRRLCEALRAIGYRGTMSVDGFVTADGEILLTETNSRISGSTHLHDVIIPRVVGPAHAGRRTVIERGGWAVPSFGAAVERLADSGLAYDPRTRAGVILIGDFAQMNGTVRYSVVAEDIVAAREVEQKMLASSP
jgi:hypothetical protein